MVKINFKFFRVGLCEQLRNEYNCIIYIYWCFCCNLGNFSQFCKYILEHKQFVYDQNIATISEYLEITMILENSEFACNCLTMQWYKNIVGDWINISESWGCSHQRAPRELGISWDCSDSFTMGPDRWSHMSVIPMCLFLIGFGWSWVPCKFPILCKFPSHTNTHSL